MSTGTVRLHRVLRAPPERVYRAFLNAEAKAKTGYPVSSLGIDLAEVDGETTCL